MTKLTRFVLISAFLYGCATQDHIDPPPAPVELEQAEPDTVSRATARPEDRRVTIAAVGDIMLGTDYPENRLPPDDAATYLRGATPLLSSADIAFGNLEGVLMSGGEPAKTCHDPAACYLFRSPPRYAAHLRAAGFDVMSLANNHARDFGEAGRDATMAALDTAGILHSGREGTVASWQQQGLRFALIAFSPTKGSWPLLATSMATEAVAAAAAGHDIVIVSFHGGTEGTAGAERLGFGMKYAYGEKRGNVVDFAHRVIDAGADLVIGHGPHVPRAVELYKERLIAYSLGNFATYYGISVSGPKGLAPLLMAELDGHGRFIGGKVHSFIQVRPNGPRLDSELRAANMIRELTALDFPAGRLVVGGDGTLSKRSQPPALTADP